MFFTQPPTLMSETDNAAEFEPLKLKQDRERGRKRGKYYFI